MPRFSEMRITQSLAFVATVFVLSGISLAQIKPAAGIRQNTPNVHAFINAKIVVGPGRVIGKGTLVIRNGTISAIGAGIAVPADARVWDLSGMTIYPGFIDAYSDIGVPKKASTRRGSGSAAAPAEAGDPRAETLE